MIEMKIRKFNESVDNEIDATYVRQCFVDLIDSGKATTIERSSAAYGSWMEIHCLIEFPNAPVLDNLSRRKIGSAWLTNTNKIDKVVKQLEETKDLMKEIENCINRLADEYPNYSYKTGSDDSLYFGTELRKIINVIIFP